jgi:hypothetical protein
MVEAIDLYSKASEVFDVKKQDLITKRKYRSIKTLLAFSEDLVSETTKICDKYNGTGIIALGITDLIAARVREPDEIFNKMLVFFEEKGITTDVQTESLRYKSAVCLSIYLQRQTKAIK